MANAQLGPLNTEQLQFAIDVMKHLIRKHYPNLVSNFVKTEVVMGVEGCRVFVKEHFVGNILKVVDEIDTLQSIEVRREFSSIKDKDAPSLEDFISAFKKDALPKDFNAANFLAFCVHVSLMSLLFKESGNDDALFIAVRHVITSFPENEDEAKLIWKQMNSIDKKYKPDAPAVYRSKTTEDISSGTDESSNSSTTNTGSDCASESRNVTSASSAESLNELIMRLNASTVESSNRVKIKENVTSGPSNKVANIIANKESGAASTPLCTITLDGSECAIPAAGSECAIPAASTECVISVKNSDDPNKVEGEKIEPSSCTDFGNKAENIESSQCHISGTSGTTSFKCVASENEELNVEENVQNSPSSSVSKMPTCEVDSLSKSTTLEVKSLQRTPVKSPTKSFLGKRPSPRSGVSLRGAADNSEIETKKPKLQITEKTEEDKQ